MRTRLFIAAATAALLGACGGGGGGGGSEPTTTGPTTVTLTGSASKGPLRNADAAVHAIDAQGRIAPTPLATVALNSDGSYSIPFTATPGQPVVVIVKARPGGATTHVDEVTGQTQPLPDGFTLRALVVPAAGTTTLRGSATPLSDMAVAAAEKASGGITADNAAKALSTQRQMFGFDAAQVAPKSAAEAATPDEQKLALLLVSVSKMANDGAVGCSGSGGERAQCVVSALRESSSTESIKPGRSGSRDVGAEMNTAVSQVIDDDALRGAVPRATMAPVVASLGCQTNCGAAAPGTQPAGGEREGIAAAKLLFADLRSNAASLFSRGGIVAGAQGAFNAAAFRFGDAMQTLERPLTTMTQTVQAFGDAAKLYDNYKAGRTTNPNLVRTSRSVPVSNRALLPAGYTETACTVYQDAQTTLVATSPANANFVGCSSIYYVAVETIVGGNRQTQYRHGFVLTPTATGFDWQSRARRTVLECKPGCVRTANDNLQSVNGADRFFAGTLTLTKSGTELVAFNASGEWPAGLAVGGALVGDKHVVSLKGERTLDPASGDTKSMVFGGRVDNQDAAAASLGLLVLKDGSRIDAQAVKRTIFGEEVAPSSPLAGTPGWSPASMALDLEFATPTARLTGTFSATDPAWDASGSTWLPTKTLFDGRAAVTSAGTTTEIFAGRFSATVTGYAGFNATQPSTASANRYTIDSTISGAVSAPGRPRLELVFATTLKDGNADALMTAGSLTYRTLVGGVARTTVTLAGSASAAGGEIDRFELKEAAADLLIAFSKGADSAAVRRSGTEIGTLNLNSGVVTFKDGTSESLDIGL